MPDINITVAHKVAVSDTQSIVCDNSDYTVHWALDEEWSAYDAKTMRTIYMDGTYEDKVFSGADIALPVCTVPGAVQIGLFAGDIRTSRVAILRALPSVRSAAGAPADPAPDVYDQLMELINGMGGADPDVIAKAVADYLAAHPIEETDPTVPEWAKAEITGATVGQIAKITAIDTDGKPTAWSPVDMPSSGDLSWIEVVDITTEEQTQQLTISVDKDGRPLSQYNALWMIFSVLFPADATQTSTNGAPWIYPLPKMGDSAYRYIATVPGWKTVERTLTFAWAGLPRITWSSAIYMQTTFVAVVDPDFLSGLCMYINSSSNHIPAGTRVRIAALSKGVTA